MVEAAKLVDQVQQVRDELERARADTGSGNVRVHPGVTSFAVSPDAFYFRLWSETWKRLPGGDTVKSRIEIPLYSSPGGGWVYSTPSRDVETVYLPGVISQIVDMNEVPEDSVLARRLVAQAGYGPDNPLQIELRYNTSDEHRRIALAVQAMWKEALGVETTLINEEFQVLLANMREAEVTQVFRTSWIGDYNDAHTFLSIVESDNASNMPRYANEEFDAVMDQAAKQLNPKWRRVHLEEAERVFLADHAVIPLYFFVSKHLVSPQVSGWGDNVLDYHYSQHLSLAPVDATP